MFQVTVDIFSGRPNPSWLVSGPQAQEILKDLARSREAMADADSGTQKLGYRGISVELLADQGEKEFDLPGTFLIGGGSSADESKGLEIATRLIETAPAPEADAATPLDADLKKLILSQIAAFPDALAAIEPDPGYSSAADGVDLDVPADATSCGIELGAFNPGFWNNDPNVRRNNNCYNYGANRKTNTFAQPGRASGRYPYPMACPDVSQAAISDGAHVRFRCCPDTEKPRWFVALVVWPGNDYHWYRKHREGFWGHKPGGTHAKNTDDRGMVIGDPRTCARGPYTHFCGFFYVCKKVRIR
ncbi:MAG: hypothetical protein AB1646_24180 [Thermodesulfobacteriota bacterium]